MKIAWTLVAVWAAYLLVRGYRAWSDEYERTLALKNPFVRE